MSDDTRPGGVGCKCRWTQAGGPTTECGYHKHRRLEARATVAALTAERDEALRQASCEHCGGAGFTVYAAWDGDPNHGPEMAQAECGCRGESYKQRAEAAEAQLAAQQERITRLRAALSEVFRHLDLIARSSGDMDTGDLDCLMTARARADAALKEPS